MNTFLFEYCLQIQANYIIALPENVYAYYFFLQIFGTENRYLQISKARLMEALHILRKDHFTNLKRWKLNMSKGVRKFCILTWCQCHSAITFSFYTMILIILSNLTRICSISWKFLHSVWAVAEGLERKSARAIISQN